MTFWQFLDKQIGRSSPTGVAGAGIFLLTGVILWMLGHDHALATNDLFKTLSQAIVVQGLVGLAMAAWFTKRPGDNPTGTKDDPLAVQGAQDGTKPVTTETADPTKDDTK